VYVCGVCVSCVVWYVCMYEVCVCVSVICVVIYVLCVCLWCGVGV